MADKKLDPHERPPDFIRNVYRTFRKMSKSELDDARDILDFGRDLDSLDGVAKLQKIPKATVVAACSHIGAPIDVNAFVSEQDGQIYEARDVPGLQVIPSLLPNNSQVELLSRLLHRDLADHRHHNNVQLHHLIPYHATRPSAPVSLGSEVEPPQVSFFNMPPKSPEPFVPLDARAHKPFTISHFLNRKLRWVTLGGQYDWTQKKYPLKNPTFPADLADFTHDFFPSMKAEAAIVNVYTPGDTLSMHRDVSEESDRGLVSISLGCDAIFVVGLFSADEGNPRSLVLRLHSGDAVYMSGSARFAWHGVPQIIPDTCPHWLRCWPARENANSVQYDVSDPYEPWRNWMSKKRINLNIRQMRD